MLLRRRVLARGQSGGPPDERIDMSVRLRHARSLHLSALRGRFAAPIATLTTVAFMATFAPPRAARAGTENVEPADTPNFSEASNGVKGGAEAASSTAKATKSRKTPVSANGSFGHSINIQLPPGRLGMTPSLALRYDSSSVAESAVGVGWSFGPPMISRSTRMGFPRVTGPDVARTYEETTAVFTGPSGEMVPATDGPAGTTGTMYMPARESSPIRFEYIASAAGGTFIEHDPSGRKRYYGEDPCMGRTGRVRNELGTHAWLLVRDVDRFGNAISYGYHNEAEATRSNRRVAQRTPILGSVEWGGNGCVATDINPFRITTSIVAQAGPLNLLDGNTLLDQRITKIDVKVDNAIKWTYTLGYATSADTGKSLLTTVQRAGDAPETTTFSYSAGAPTSVPRFEPARTLEGPVPMYTNSSAWQESLSNFAPERMTPVQAVQAPGFRPGTKFIDVDGNGTTDAVYHAGGTGTSATHVLWEESALQAPSSSGLGLWSSPPTSGAIQVGTGLPYFPINGGWTSPGFGSRTVTELTDVDGDGDADAVTLPLTIEVRPGQGTAIIPPPPHVENETPGQMRIRVVTNTARSAGAQHPAEQILDNWPLGAFLATTIYSTPAPSGGGALRYKPEPKGDVLFPVLDLNADGRSDAVLLKHRSADPSMVGFGAAIALPHSAIARAYSFMVPQELGEIINDPLEQEVRDMVHQQHAVVLVDEDLLRTTAPPDDHVRLWTSAGRLGIPELSPGTPVVLLSTRGGVGAPGFPPGPGGPLGPFVPPTVPERVWYMPLVDPEGDVWLPLKDSYAIGGAGSGSTFLGGQHHYVPRVYLTRGQETRSFAVEQDENVSHFERSLQKALNKGSAQACVQMADCQYPPHANFNSFFADVNGDGLPDLVSAVTPNRVTNSYGDPEKTTVCGMGHRVQLNRGYAFEDAPSETLPGHTWTNPGDPTNPFTRVANRDRSCANTRPRICV